MKSKEYSEKEIKLIEHFGFGDIMKNRDIPAPTIYQMCVNAAFISSEDGPYTKSLRRCFTALINCRIYRMTPEWDDLIQFED